MMLSPEEVEMVHAEVDGAHTPAESAAARALMAREPEAAALAAELRQMGAMLAQVAERAPPPHLRTAILAAVPPRARAGMRGIAGAERPPSGWDRVRSYVHNAARQLEDGIMSKKQLMLGVTAVAIIAIIAGSLIDFSPNGALSGSMGDGQGSDTEQQDMRDTGDQDRRDTLPQGMSDTVPQGMNDSIDKDGK